MHPKTKSHFIKFFNFVNSSFENKLVLNKIFFIQEHKKFNGWYVDGLYLLYMQVIIIDSQKEEYMEYLFLHELTHLILTQHSNHTAGIHTKNFYGIMNVMIEIWMCYKQQFISKNERIKESVWISKFDKNISLFEFD